MADSSSGALFAAAAVANDGTLPTSLEVRLEVTDPEVVAELGRHTEGAARDRFAMSALRIGVLALRTASGQIDAVAIRHEWQALVGDVRELLTERATNLTKDLSTSLAQYLDPKSGELSRRVQALVQKDGELDRLLGAHLGPQDSVLARSLTAHLGEGSAIFKMLSPSDANGLRAQLAKTLEDALGEQKKTILREFSLDHPESALSRLVLRVEATEKKIGAQFSTDDDTSALSRLSKMLQATSDQVGKNLTLDDEGSALSRLKRELLATIEDLAKKNVELQLQVRETLGRLEKGKDDAERTTLKGAIFEDALGELLHAEAQRFGDLHEATGSTVGTIKNNKVGDFVIQLGAESAAAHARIAWEAKEDQKYDVKRALEEIDEARRNRQAQVGVFVFLHQDGARRARSLRPPRQRHHRRLGRRRRGQRRPRPRRLPFGARALRPRTTRRRREPRSARRDRSRHPRDRKADRLPRRDPKVGRDGEEQRREDRRTGAEDERRSRARGREAQRAHRRVENEGRSRRLMGRVRAPSSTAR